MRKGIVIIFLLIYASFQLGTLAWYYYKPVIHALCYSRLSTRSGKNHLEQEIVINTDTHSFQLAKQDEHEILWKAELYDIKELSIKGDVVVINAVKDTRETHWMELFNSVQKQLTKNSGSHPLRDINFYNWMSKLYTSKEDRVQLVPISLQFTKILSYSEKDYYSFIAEGPCQPPDNII
jgi:hypothetical protein